MLTATAWPTWRWSAGRGRSCCAWPGPARRGVLEAPEVVNPDPRLAARELAIVSTRRGPVLAALDAKDPSLSLYARGPDGTFTRSAGPGMPPDDLPVALAAG